MRCPDCGDRTKVTETQTFASGVTVWRRHVCTTCNKRFTTLESIISHPVPTRKWERKSKNETERVPRARRTEADDTSSNGLVQ